jgi:hypothetical protein
MMNAIIPGRVENQKFIPSAAMPPHDGPAELTIFGLAEQSNGLIPAESKDPGVNSESEGSFRDFLARLAIHDRPLNPLPADFSREHIYDELDR